MQSHTSPAGLDMKHCVNVSVCEGVGGRIRYHAAGMHTQLVDTQRACIIEMLCCVKHLTLHAGV